MFPADETTAEIDRMSLLKIVQISNGEMKTVILVAGTNISPEQAREVFAAHDNILRSALEALYSMRNT